MSRAPALFARAASSAASLPDGDIDSKGTSARPCIGASAQANQSLRANVDRACLKSSQKGPCAQAFVGHQGRGIPRQIPHQEGSVTVANLAAPIKARNKPGYFAAKEVLGAVRTIVAELICPCCRRRPTAKEVLSRLPEPLKRTPRRIDEYIREVMKELVIE
jgi:hypothetical protein